MARGWRSTCALLTTMLAINDAQVSVSVQQPARLFAPRVFFAIASHPPPAPSTCLVHTRIVFRIVSKWLPPVPLVCVCVFPVSLQYDPGCDFSALGVPQQGGCRRRTVFASFVVPLLC